MLPYKGYDFKYQQEDMNLKEFFVMFARVFHECPYHLIKTWHNFHEDIRFYDLVVGFITGKQTVFELTWREQVRNVCHWNAFRRMLLKYTCEIQFSSDTKKATLYVSPTFNERSQYGVYLDDKYLYECEPPLEFDFNNIALIQRPIN